MLYNGITSNTINTVKTERRTMDFNLRSKIPIFEQVKNQIKKYIDLGVYAPKDKLPSVRELASSLNVNPNTIERAFNELETEGYIYSLNKKGFFVSEKVRILTNVQILSNLEKEIILAKNKSISKTDLLDLLNKIYKEGENNND